MKKILGSLLSLFLIFGLCSTASAISYSGSLTSGDGLEVSGWSDAGLKWVVDDESARGYWTYQYYFTVSGKDISNIIIEVSPDFSSSDIIKTYTEPEAKMNDPQTYKPDNNYPGLPADVYGIKWEWPDTETAVITIVTTREPMWGDFYASGGLLQVGTGKVKETYDVYAFNTGFGKDPDNVPISEANAGVWVLVPDTRSAAPVPEPATLFLLGSGLTGVGAFARRKFKR